MSPPQTNLVSDLCDPYCVDSTESPPPPPPDKTSLPLILDLFIAAVFASVLLLAVYSFYLRRRRNRATRSPTRPDDFLDHGPVPDHHVWYITTVGLRQSLVDSIAVFRYKSGEGVVEGTECSVCLSEFREEEALRLLPKCSHAFHVPCIDAWLRSHTNCPICRAPIVSDSNSITGGEARVTGEEDGERTEEAQDQAQSQTIRRSFSLGFLSSSKIRLPEEIDQKSETQMVKSRIGSSTERNRVGMNQSGTERNRVGMNQSGSGSSSRSMERSFSLGLLSSSKLRLLEEIDQSSETQMAKSITRSSTERNRVGMNQSGSGSSSRSMERSFSLGFLSSSKLRLPEEIDQNSETQMAKSRTRSSTERNRVAMKNQSGSGSSSRSMERSFSLGFLSSSKLRLLEEINQNSETQMAESRIRSITERNRVVMNQSRSGSSSRTMERSVSCSARLFSSRNSLSRSSILPL